MKRLTPKYILLTAPTNPHSVSTHEHSIHLKSFDHLPPKSPFFKDIPTNKELPAVSNSQSNPTTKEFSTLQQDLTSCMQQIVGEQKKNNILKELNKVLQANNREAEQTEVKVVKLKSDKERKQMKKQEYLIEQILQKHNEQVARITNLRQQVNSARTDRVVFSALFKKIEKEIKYYESLYQSKILKNQIKIITKSQEVEPQPIYMKGQSQDQCENKDDHNNSFSLNESIINSSNRFFMTAPDKNKQTFYKKATDRIKDPTKLILAEMAQLEGKIERIVIDAQCHSPQDVFSCYNDIEADNSALLQKINQAEFAIGDLQDEIEQLRQKRRNSEVVEERHMTKLTNLPSTRKMRSCKTIKNGQESPLCSTTEFLQYLAEIANFKSTAAPFQTLNQLQCLLLGEENRKSQCSSDPNLSTILNRMQKFDNCQRIFSKRQFQGQYLRELGKQKKQLKIKR